MPWSDYFSVAAILGCEFCERLAYYGIGSSLVLFLRRNLLYSTEQATVYYSIWGAFATIFSLIGGYLSDRYIGRKKTILIGVIIYFFSLLTISILTYFFELTDDLQLNAVEVIFWISLYTLSLGGGGIKANVGPFGADQLYYINKSRIKASSRELTADLDPIESDNLISYDVGTAAIDIHAYDIAEQSSAELVQSYWNWFYFSINAGALISYTLIAYLCQDVSFALGWSIPTAAIFVCFILFIFRSNHYYEPRHDSSLINKFVSVSCYAIKNRSRKKEIVSDLNNNVFNTFNPNGNNEDYRNRDITWLDVAKIKFGGEYDQNIVEEIKSVYAVFIFLPFMTAYWVVYSAMNSLFYSQGCQMNYSITTSFDFPIAALNDADIIVILILVPIVDRFIYPFINGPSGCCRLTMLRKIGVGFVILALSMIVSGLIEVWRKSAGTLDIVSTCDDTVYISELSVLWQIPQYLLVGVSEVFASITSLEFFAGQAPESMKSIVYATNLLVVGIGFLIAGLLVVIVDLFNPEWIPNDLDDGYLEYYYFLVAGIMIVALIIFIPCAQKYKYKDGTDVSATPSSVGNLSNRSSAKYKALETDDTEALL